MRQPELTSERSCHNLRATSEGEGDAQQEAAQELERDAYADAVYGSAGGWGWLNTGPAPKRDDAAEVRERMQEMEWGRPWVKKVTKAAELI